MSRPIDQRFVPGVAGVDLEQALNYVDLDDVGERFIYDRFTSGRTFYKQGSRPRLEAALRQILPEPADPRHTVARIARWVAENVRWAGYHQHATGRRLPPDRYRTEEDLLDLGYGWCNEQARLTCALAQIAGLPSRLVFAFNRTAGYGHVISEILTAGAWMAVDQSFGYCFVLNETPIPAAAVYRDPAARAHFAPIYSERCARLQADLGPIITTDFTMAAAAEPLDGFSCLGYHNYFIH